MNSSRYQGSPGSKKAFDYPGRVGNGLKNSRMKNAMNKDLTRKQSWRVLKPQKSTKVLIMLPHAKPSPCPSPSFDHFDNSVMRKSPSLNKLDGKTLKGSGSAGSLFDKLSSAGASVSDGEIQSQPGSRLAVGKGMNTQKFYHMSYVETV